MKAISNLYCSLSVMYLLRGRQTKDINKVNKAIQLANNNIEARVLKGLILMEKGKREEGIN